MVATSPSGYLLYMLSGFESAIGREAANIRKSWQLNTCIISCTLPDVSCTQAGVFWVLMSLSQGQRTARQDGRVVVASGLVWFGLVECVAGSRRCCTIVYYTL